MTDYRRHAEAAEKRPFPYLLASFAIIALAISAAEQIAWLMAGRGEYWLISKWIIKSVTDIVHNHPGPTLLVACMAMICGTTAWASRRARPGDSLGEALEKDPAAQARWINDTPR